ncbi:uncharacterized protein LOC105442051 [Strongylocentrotus purpuratus]|uniref:Uncharacterized protein n=1 Tax=Strongylocentrotus purpuratus TaxID=7668 RepID=A0A7M7P994_STRPU|nr:uncharacterized protein LOC105442051 [Strongylocentrotus purpuratus]
MGISMNVAAILCLVVIAGAAIRTTDAMVFTSKISLHLDAACGLFTEELMDEGGKCDPDVIEEVMDEADEIEGLGGIDGEKIEDYLEEAEEGKMCYSPDGENVTNLKDGCSAMEAVCNEQANVMYCKEMATVTNTQ